jgi:hypothetical protein
MNMAWSGIGILCDKCGKPTQLTEAFVSADLEFKFYGECHECKQTTEWRVYGSLLQWQALRNDLAREKVEAKQNPGTPVKPPIALPQNNPDKEFLDFMENIGGNDVGGDKEVSGGST